VGVEADEMFISTELESEGKGENGEVNRQENGPLTHRMSRVKESDTWIDRCMPRDENGRIDYREVSFVPEDERLRPCERLKGSDDFSRVLRAGGTIAFRGANLNIKAARMPTTWGGHIPLDELGRRPRCRLGVISSKKRMRRAVDRARFRRIVRAAFRTNKLHLPMDVDLVISPASSTSHECSLQTATSELLAFNSVFREGKLIRKDRVQGPRKRSSKRRQRINRGEMIPPRHGGTSS